MKLILLQVSKKQIYTKNSQDSLSLLMFAAKISFNIILLNLDVRIIAIFLLIDLFIFSS